MNSLPSNYPCTCGHALWQHLSVYPKYCKMCSEYKEVNWTKMDLERPLHTYEPDNLKYLKFKYEQSNSL